MLRHAQKSPPVYRFDGKLATVVAASPRDIHATFTLSRILAEKIFDDFCTTIGELPAAIIVFALPYPGTVWRRHYRIRRTC